MSNRHTPETRDWFCPSCKGKVFASKGVCRCGYKRGSGQSKKSNDWKCPGCNGLVYGSKDKCKCGTSKNGSANHKASTTQKPGDWNCPGCNGLVFASKNECRKCGTSKPSTNTNHSIFIANTTAEGTNHNNNNNNNTWPGIKPGDWRCVSCNENNFASRQHCFKCRLPN